MNAPILSLPGGMVGALREMHDPDRGWIFVEQLRLGTGYHGFADQTLDGWAIKCWMHNGVCNLRRSFELKSSSSDLRKELLNPDKRWVAYAVSHEFYFVAPTGLINPKLLAKEDGLIEWDQQTGKLRTVKAPRVREAMIPRWDFVASLTRRLAKGGLQ